ncbi:MAG: 23S rRNA (adenine(2503)-C(2))-methyltransferase RlmN [Synergistaceae bacterium]|jgi:23S rRNA (adenine2503-C2)-methyltransferase|nr:23S rRNA (adenine(2503)-C(2))-methyltransferase RlmN [Synergistaceae bacterium]
MPTPERESALLKNHDAWASYFASLNEPSYRAAQICDWLWKRGIWDVGSMTDLGKNLRELLPEAIDFSHPEISSESKASDGTKKFLVTMPGGATVETALLKHGPRLTACVSTQVGCPVGCPFCVTGAGGFDRNLSAGEIAAQLVTMERHIGRAIQSVVMMGMGEPFLNTDETLEAVRMLNSPKMRGLGIRHITISTVGIIPGIRALTESGLGVRLAVSLHAADDELRNRLAPCNSNYPLGDLMESLRDYQRVTGDRITIEYAMFKDVNDSIAHARALVRRLHGLHSYVNLIPANESGMGYERSDPESILKFQSVLQSAGFESEIRVERGTEINASCGQLRRASRDLAPESAKKPASPRRDKPHYETGSGNGGDKKFTGKTSARTPTREDGRGRDKTRAEEGQRTGPGREGGRTTERGGASGKRVSVSPKFSNTSKNKKRDKRF